MRPTMDASILPAARWVRSRGFAFKLWCPGRRSIRSRGFDNKMREISQEASPFGRERGVENLLY